MNYEDKDRLPVTTQRPRLLRWIQETHGLFLSLELQIEHWRRIPTHWIKNPSTEMGKSLISSTNVALTFYSRLPGSISTLHPSTFSRRLLIKQNLATKCRLSGGSRPSGRTNLFAKAVLSDDTHDIKQFHKVGANSTGPIPPEQLIQVVEAAAKAGAEVYSFLCTSFKWNTVRTILGDEWNRY